VAALEQIAAPSSVTRAALVRDPLAEREATPFRSTLAADVRVAVVVLAVVVTYQSVVADPVKDAIPLESVVVAESTTVPDPFRDPDPETETVRSDTTYPAL
jgi:hypothetical protein